ncbi:hypothetical protein BKA66DRAFT_85706 [Pyrenochaeta sp. MPI-SDFR-AT-0127]|nr:hypothetical protein BKA66DRAFT_85706 [Pyrenochaeta sp. MPI-SDFR-AT-0127]
MSVCIEMANVHNLILRGLNAIYLQAPYVSKAQDVADFMLYVHAWADMVHHHHSVEEAIFFPRAEELAREAGLPESLMKSNFDQHHEFEPKMAEMARWADRVREGKEEYKSEFLVGMIDRFAPILKQHLHEEIDTLIMLEKCDGEEVKKVMKLTADAGQKNADPNLVIPLALGCVDRRYTGSENFPPVPFFVPWLNAYWFARKHQGCWRFNPCDHWGKPRPLQFL